MGHRASVNVKHWVRYNTNEKLFCEGRLHTHKQKHSALNRVDMACKFHTANLNLVDGFHVIICICLHNMENISQMLKAHVWTFLYLNPIVQSIIKVLLIYEFVNMPTMKKCTFSCHAYMQLAVNFYNTDMTVQIPACTHVLIQS